MNCIITRAGFLLVPITIMPMIDTTVIVTSVNEMFVTLPHLAKKQLRWYSNLIKGAKIISGHIETVDDVFPLIAKMESEQDIELTDRQVEKIASDTETMLQNDFDTDNTIPDVDTVEKESPVKAQAPVHENLFITHNASGDIVW